MNMIKVSPELAMRLCESTEDQAVIDGFTVVDRGACAIVSEDPKLGTYKTAVVKHEGKCYQVDMCKLDSGPDAGWLGFYDPSKGEWDPKPQEVTLVEVAREEKTIVTWKPV